MAPKDAVLMDIMETNVKFVTTHTDQEEAARLLSKYDFLALPVVDAEERLVGIVTVDDAIDVIQEETTEDMEMMAAISPRISLPPRPACLPPGSSGCPGCCC